MPYPEDINQIIVLIFTAIMLIAFMHALKSYYLNNNSYAINFYSGTLTSLGILGTFTGIALGIIYFDTQVIDDSLISMIQGFKTAFITSIVGLTLSIILKQVTFIKPNKIILESTKESPYSLLEDAIIQQTYALRKFEENTSRNIVDGLQSVVTEFNKHIDQQFGQNLEGVSNSFNIINTTMTALNQNIVNFEDHVNALNIAVESTENTHANSANALKDLIDKIAQTQLQLKNLSVKTELNDEHFEQVKQSSEHLSNVTLKLHEQFDKFNHQLANTAATSQEQQEVTTKAIQEHFKNTQNNLINAFNDVSKKDIVAQKSLLTEINKAADTQAQFILQIEKALAVHEKINESAVNKTASLSEQVTSIAQTNETFMMQMSSRLTTEFEKVINTQYNTFKEAQTSTQEALQQALKAHDNKHEVLLNKHYQQFDKQLNSEMKNSLEQLSKVMGFVSGEFARDFQQLIDHMDSVKSEFKEQVLESHV